MCVQTLRSPQFSNDQHTLSPTPSPFTTVSLSLCLRSGVVENARAHYITRTVPVIKKLKNSTVPRQYLNSTITVLKQYLNSTKTVLKQYLNSTKTVLKQYLNSTKTVLERYLEGPTQYLDGTKTVPRGY